MTSRPLARLLEYLRPRRRKVWLATTYSIVNKIFDLAPPLLIGLSVDIVVQREASFIASLGVEAMMSQLVVVAILTFIIWALESLFEYLQAVTWRTLAQEVQHDLRQSTYEHVQELEVAYFEDKSTGNLIAILNDDVNQLERFLDSGANDLLQVGTTVIVIGGIYFALSPMIALFSFLPIPFIIVGSLIFQKKIEPRYQKVRGEVGLLSSLLSNNLSGISTIKSYGAESYESFRLRQQSFAYAEANNSAIRLSSSFSPLIRMVVLVGFLTGMLLGGHLVQSGLLAVGSYSVVVFMTQRLLWPLTRLGQTLDLYQRAMASTRRIFEIKDTPIKLVDGPNQLDKKQARGHVHFEEVSFSYTTGPRILDRLTLDIPAGKTLALVGATGSGKSTIVKLLLRFYDPTHGRITIDGVDLKHLGQHNLRSLISYVHQDTYLFHGSVRDNIRYGTFEASDEQIEKAAKLAEAHDFIQRLPEGYDTIVGERGQKLSGGQRQRLAIARAILKDAPIFIFDEATSSVDNETEAAIQRSLEHITRSKTTIVIAHRLSTIVNADRIYVLGHGEIVESGRHEELITLQGPYSELWNVQTGRQTQPHNATHV
jgi:ATP-binding cassette, subfamily B, bacterial